MQKWIKLIFAVYLLVLVKVIIFKYPYDQLYAIAQTWRRDVILEGLGTANFIPFKTVKMYIKYADKLNSFENLAGNIVVFIPFGILFPLLRSDKSNFPDVFANALILVLGIEIFQLFSAFGAFDVDDIILNCLGASLGYFVYKMCHKLFQQHSRKLKTLYSFNRIYSVYAKFAPNDSNSQTEEMHGIKIKEDDYGAYFEKN